VKHVASPQFWLAYRKLPASIRRLARKNLKLLKSDMRHPSLHLKRVDSFWSVRIGQSHRALEIVTK
jgi:mRNA-degrading endonuclease RelE of RelBE toxin-antitoxin system